MILKVNCTDMGSSLSSKSMTILVLWRMRGLCVCSAAGHTQVRPGQSKLEGTRTSAQSLMYTLW